MGFYWEKLAVVGAVRSEAFHALAGGENAEVRYLQTVPSEEQALASTHPF